jgi:hypothetical protein
LVSEGVDLWRRLPKWEDCQGGKIGSLATFPKEEELQDLE